MNINIYQIYVKNAEHVCMTFLTFKEKLGKTKDMYIKSRVQKHKPKCSTHTNLSIAANETALQSHATNLNLLNNKGT